MAAMTRSRRSTDKADGMRLSSESRSSNQIRPASTTPCDSTHAATALGQPGACRGPDAAGCSGRTPARRGADAGRIAGEGEDGAPGWARGRAGGGRWARLSLRAQGPAQGAVRHSGMAPPLRKTAAFRLTERHDFGEAQIAKSSSSPAPAGCDGPPLRRVVSFSGLDSPRLSRPHVGNLGSDSAGRQRSSCPLQPPKAGNGSSTVRAHGDPHGFDAVTLTALSSVTPTIRGTLMDREDDKDWCSINEAARRLKVTPTAIRNRIKRRTLETKPNGNHGRLVRVPYPVPSPVPLIVPETVTPT